MRVTAAESLFDIKTDSYGIELFDDGIKATLTLRRHTTVFGSINVVTIEGSPKELRKLGRDLLEGLRKP